MYITYILQNNKSKRFYIGSTNNIFRRLSEHNRGQTTSTRQQGKWTLVLKEEYNTIIEAINREKLLKSYKGGLAFKRLIAGVVQQ